MFCPLGALRVAKGVCDFCDETTLEEMRKDVFSYFENSNKNVFFKTCFSRNSLDRMIRLRATRLLRDVAGFAGETGGDF
jgi:hypothetical protein